MSSVDIGVYGEELYEQVLPLHGPDPDGLARDYVGAIVSQVLEIDDLARDDAQGRPGWGAILDVADCPIKGLPWLAQIAGVSLRDQKLLTTPNLISNPSFESGTTDWYRPTPLGAISAITSPTLRGPHSGEFTVEIAQNLAPDPLPAGTYVLSFDARSDAVGDALGVELDAPTVGTPNVVLDAVELTTDWNRYVFEVEIADISQRTLYFASGGTGPFYLDGVAFAALIGDMADVPAYFDTSYSLIEPLETWAVYARDAIRRQGGKGRGTVDAMLSAAEDTLIGTRTGRILERVGGNAYALELVTRPSETLNPAATLAAALTQKPAGMSLTHTLTEGVIIDEGTSTIDTATATIDTATLGDVT